ncbi:MAG TPA: hypothetical protein VK308_11940, partial [Pyrinomonadaceae bacterium]|nr:hypothetical protein [Pyrinomonadaceae bacterium]
MKLRLLLIASLILLLTLQIFAQEKPQALKFDEFDEVVENLFYSDTKELPFSERVKRFSKQLEKERNVRAYVIYYQARIFYPNSGWQSFVNQVNGIKNQIQFNDRVNIKD